MSPTAPIRHRMLTFNVGSQQNTMSLAVQQATSANASPFTMASVGQASANPGPSMGVCSSAVQILQRPIVAIVAHRCHRDVYQLYSSCIALLQCCCSDPRSLPVVFYKLHCNPFTALLQFYVAPPQSHSYLSLKNSINYHLNSCYLKSFFFPLAITDITFNLPIINSFNCYLTFYSNHHFIIINHYQQLYIHQQWVMCKGHDQVLYFVQFTR